MYAFKEGWSVLFGYENAANSQWSADTKYGIVLTVWDDVTGGPSEVHQIGTRYEYYVPPDWLDDHWPSKHFLERANKTCHSCLPVRVAVLSGRRNPTPSKPSGMSVRDHLYWLRILSVSPQGEMRGYFLRKEEYYPIGEKHAT